MSCHSQPGPWNFCWASRPHGWSRKLLRMRIGTGLRTFTLTAGVQNYAFFVIPIIQMLFAAGNDPTLGVLFVHNVGCELVVWSIGVIIIAGGPGNLNMGVFFRGPLLAVIVGLALAWSGLGTYVAQPPLMKTFEMIGNCATPLCLILFRRSMRDLWHNMKWEPKPIICGLLTRLGLAPALLLLAIRPISFRWMIISSASSSSRQPFPPPSFRSFWPNVSEAIRTW